MPAHRIIGRERWADASDDQRLWDAVYQSNLIEGISEYPIYTSSEGEEPPKLHAFMDHLGALEWVIEQAGLRPPSAADALEAHRRLMGNIMEDAGQYRAVQVWVGGRGLPLPAYLRYLMKSWEQDVLSWEDKKPSERLLWENHYLFEHIHPFRDGNGRTGRLLLNWSYLRHFDKLVIMEASNKEEYYHAINDYRSAFHQRFPDVHCSKDKENKDWLLDVFLRLEKEERRRNKR